MNICNYGVYFATDHRLPRGEMIQVHLKMPREVVETTWRMVLHRPRRACPKPLGAKNG